MGKTATLPPEPETKALTPVASAPKSDKPDSLSIIASFQTSDAAKNSKFAVCKPGGDLIEAMAENSIAGDKFSFNDLPKTKVPTGGETEWKIASVAGSEVVKEIRGVLVFYGKAGTLWALDKMAEGAKPLLISNDLKDCVQISDDFGDLDQAAIEECFTHQDEAGKNHYDWEKLPYNQWGSGKNGGKRCKEQRLLCILRENDLVPVFLRVPPASVTGVHDFVKRLTLQTQRRHYESIVTLTLEKAVNKEGTPYSTVKIIGNGFVSKEEGQFFKAMYTDSLSYAMKDAAVVSETQDEIE
jgi:hypothetical protein